MKTHWMGLIACLVLGQAQAADFGNDPTFRYELEGKDGEERMGGLKISLGDEC